MGEEMPDQGFASVTRAWTVPPGQDGIRLDDFVRRCLPHLSLRETRRAIEAGAFRVDQRLGKKGDRLCGGCVLALRGFPDLLAESPVPTRDLKVSILYEDDCLLALDKPAGVATHGFSGRETRALANYLAAIRPALVGVGGNRWEAGFVHRLDRDTSGIVLAAKDQEAFDHLRSQFRRARVRKKYWALVWGKAGSGGVIDDPLIHDPQDRRKMKLSGREGGRKRAAKRWKARTRFQTVAYSRGFSLLRVELETGVTHQIRVHLAALGLPLVGDPLYARERPLPPALGRQFLHAFSLEFRHPRTGQQLIVESPLAAELREVLRGLRLPCP